MQLAFRGEVERKRKKDIYTERQNTCLSVYEREPMHVFPVASSVKNTFYLLDITLNHCQ